jgi:hypothetical protein
MCGSGVRYALWHGVILVCIKVTNGVTTKFVQMYISSISDCLQIRVSTSWIRTKTVHIPIYADNALHSPQKYTAASQPISGTQ